MKLISSQTITQRAGVTAWPKRTTQVWDRFIRAFHWSLVLLVAVAALTGFLADASWIDVHIWAGTLMAGLIVARLVWGVLGTTHARFADFFPRPAALLRHLRALRAGHAHRHMGHNPLAALMVFSLLAVLAALVMSGVVVLGGVQKAGPAAPFTTFLSGRGALTIHELLAWGLLGLIAMHVAGVAFESLRTGDNLIAAMWSGRKQVRPDDPLSAERKAHPGTALAVTLIAIGMAAAAAIHMIGRGPLGVPRAPLDAAYVRECAACHVVFHPSLLSRASWAALFADLGDHFGEDASLDEKTRAALLAYVQDHAAEAYDTKAANRLRAVDIKAPFTITRTPFWRRTHEDIAETVFDAAGVKAKSNCNACHRDAATGRFYPGNISIPKDDKS